MNVDQNGAKPSTRKAAPDAMPVSGTAGTPSRRKMIKLAATVAPAAIVMSNRPAWACDHRSPSAFASAQVATKTGAALSHSPPTQQAGGGRSANYWRQFYNPSAPHNKTTSKCNQSLPADSVSFRASVGGGSYGPNISLGTVLRTYSSNSPEWFFAAAYLNALNRGLGTLCNVPSSYPLSQGDVCAMYANQYMTGSYRWSQNDCLTYFQHSIFDDSTGTVPGSLHF